jgi:putative membrane protein
MRERVASAKTVAFTSAMLGTAISGGLLWLIYVRAPSTPNFDQLAWLPGFNAACNAASVMLLIAGYRAIRRQQKAAHLRFMLAALTSSAFFLAGYVAHHALHGDTKFAGAGAIRPVYFAILISHIALSVVVLPCILSTLYLAATGRFATHRRVARITLPMWLYVSITGVMVYGLLRAYGG